MRGKAANIDSSDLFTISEAIVAAGGDLWKFWTREYTEDFLGYVLAWHVNSKLVKAHVEDANFVRPKPAKKGRGRRS